MAEQVPSTIAPLPDDRDAAMQALWQHVFGGERGGEAAKTTTDIRLGQIDSRLDRVETRLDRVDDRLGQVETRLAVVETKMTTLEAAVARLDAAIVRLQENTRIDFRLTARAWIGRHDGQGLPLDLSSVLGESGGRPCKADHRLPYHEANDLVEAR